MAERDLQRRHDEGTHPTGATASGGSFISRIGSQLGQRYLTLVDSGIPEAMRSGDPDTLRRARIVFSFTIILVLLGLETGLFFTLALAPEAALHIQISLAMALGVILMIPVALRRWGSIVTSANLLITAAFIVTVAVFSVIGGIEAPIIHWLALFPMLAALMGASRSAWAWAGISLLTVIFFISADSLGIEFRDAFGFADLEGTTLWVQRLVNLGSWLIILLAVALLFEDQKNKQTSQLAQQNAELESQIEHRFKAEQRSHFLAYYDELTRLPNRRYFLEQLGGAIDLTSRLEHKVALLFLDLDEFKEVNDLHGHALGDQLLIHVSKRLLDCLRSTDRVSLWGAGEEDQVNVARLGGDEFTILLNGIRDPRDAAVVAERILAAITQPFTIGDLQLHIGTSIGIAICGSGDVEATDLLRNADLAMYQAKKAGKNRFKFHDDSMNVDIAVRNATMDALRSALDHDDVELYYQPIVDGATRRILSVEALVRWTRAEEFVSTETLIHLAEESGLIFPLGNWVIDRACRQYREWLDAGINPDRVSINVSGEQFRQGSVVQFIELILQKYDLPPGCIEIEITEGAMMVDEEKALSALQSLKELGTHIALDDFGTGYSSLSYIHRFPVDAIKIDRSFVRDIASDRSSQAITKAVITLAHQLGLRVVGEGVESILQESLLLREGCDSMQGYLYSRAIPGDEMTKLLASPTGVRLNKVS